MRYLVVVFWGWAGQMVVRFMEDGCFGGCFHPSCSMSLSCRTFIVNRDPLCEVIVCLYAFFFA